MTTTINFTTRPTTLDDLPDYAQAGPQVATITDATQFIRFPELGRLLLAAVAEARNLGLEVTDEGAITVPLTEEQIEAKVEAAQRSWDYERDRYLAAVEDPTSIDQGYLRNSVDRFASAEGLPAIEWPAEVSS